MTHTRFQRGFKDARGNVAAIFAICLVSLLLIVGFAIDASRQVSLKNHAQYAADAAALAGARAFATTTSSQTVAQREAQVSEAAKDSFISNSLTSHQNADCDDPVIFASDADQTVQVSAYCDTPSMFGDGLFGVGTLGASVSAQADADFSHLDLALILDQSSSMRGSKSADLKRAAKTLVDQLIPTTSIDRTRISIVPFGSHVNAAGYGDLAKGTALTVNSVPANCVMERPGDLVSYPDPTDDPAYSDAAPSPGLWSSPQSSGTFCSSDNGITPLTSDAVALKAKIDNMNTAGYTAGHVALAWSWYTISPEWSDIWPSDSQPLEYGNADHLKVIVLMTDAAFNFWRSASFDSDAQARVLCENIKAQGVIIFSVGYKVPAAGLSLLRDCATNSTHYYDARDKPELIAAYQDIASKLQGVRLAR